MEVHNHTHPAVGGTRKKWSHYFWEFLMLFLAVFCGFLAEYRLEHQIEKERGKQYVRSLHEDLRVDTARFRLITNIFRQKLAALDQLQNCHDSVTNNLGGSFCLWDLANNSIEFVDILNTDRTLQQLRNAGGFRLLNKEDADSLFKYDNLLKIALSWQTLLQESQTDLRSSMKLMIGFNSFNQMLQRSISIDDETKLAVLFEKDRTLLNKFFNDLAIYRHRVKVQLGYLEGLNIRAGKLAHFYQRKYKL